MVLCVFCLAVLFCFLEGAGLGSVRAKRSAALSECLRPECTDGAEMQTVTGLWHFLRGEYLHMAVFGLSK